MKTKTAMLRVSDEDEILLEKAAKKFQAQTGKKGMTSRTILHSVKEFANSEPEMFFCNRPAIEQVEKNVEYGREHLQNVLDQYLKVIEGETLTISELQSFFGASRINYQVTLKEAIETNIRSKKGAKMRKANPDLMFSDDQIKMPDLTELFEAAGKIIYSPLVNWNEIFYWNAYQVIDNKITVINEAVEQAKNHFRAYAQTSEEIEKLRKVRKICLMLNELLIHNLSSPDKLNLPGVAYFDGISGRFEPSEQFVKFGI